MVRVQKSVPYGAEIRQRLDIYRPRRNGAGIHPIIVYLYGGSWKSGSRKLYFLLGRALARQGYVVVIPDYRLFPEVRFPSFIEDGALAVKWAFDNAELIGGDRSQISLMGHSAGAHMGASLCVDDTYLRGTPRLEIQRFVGIAGPYSSDLTQIKSVAEVFTQAPDVDRTRPIKMVVPGREIPEMLLLHGAKDTTVNKRNTIYMASALSDVGARVSAHIYEDLGHIDIILRTMPGMRGKTQVWPEILRFLQNTPTLAA